MSEKPIERLNYFNGQRLEADDLRLEQEYHVRIQRWLMKSLFCPGVADGFDVYPIEEGKKVLVTPGLALDDLGRAIILVSPVELIPQARVLCIRYAERKERLQEDGCGIKGAKSPMAAQWGGPERILSEPEFLWKRDPPLKDTRELVIAELKLRANCSVEKVENGPRRVAVATPIAKARQLSFEGEKDIDKDNPKVLRFFIKNRRPSSVTLHLKARMFSTLYYREVGSHTHIPIVSDGTSEETVQTSVASGVDGHVHSGEPGLTTTNEHHSHTVKASVYHGLLLPGQTPQNFGIIATSPNPTVVTVLPFPGGGSVTPLHHIASTDLNKGEIAIGDPTTYSNLIHGKTGLPIDKVLPLHTHSVDIDLSNLPTGSTGPVSVRGGSQLTFFTGLAVTVDGIDCTDKILAQLKETNPSVWNPGVISITSLDGGAGEALTESGTGPIRLDLIDGLTFDPDEFVPHEIELSVEGEGNGGCIQYNLYVE